MVSALAYLPIETIDDGFAIIQKRAESQVV